MLMDTMIHKKEVAYSALASVVALGPFLMEPLAGSLMEHTLGNAALSAGLLSLVSPVWGQYLS